MSSLRGYWTLMVWLLVLPLAYADNTVKESGDNSLEVQTKNWPDTWIVPEQFHDVFNVIFDDIDFAHHQNIKIRKKPLGTTMAVRPTIGSLITRKREHRKYLLQVNNDKTFDGVLYEDVPASARIGLMMHEMMHIKDYQSRGFFGVLQRGCQYLSKNGKKKFEHEIDQMVIEAGYRDFLYLWALFIMEESEASQAYKDFKREIYLSPSDIISDLEEVGMLEESPHSSFEDNWNGGMLEP
jgi:hypothetical protein